MGKFCKLKSIEDIKKETENLGYAFLCSEYLGSHKKYEYACLICKKKIFRNHHDFLRSKPCTHETKNPYDFASEHNYSLLDTYEKCVGVKYRYMCLSCNGIRNLDHHTFSKHTDCPNCRKLHLLHQKEKEAEDKRLQILGRRKQKVKYKIVEDRGETIVVSCFKSHQFIIDLSIPLNFQRCKYCLLLNTKITKEQIIDILNKHNYVLVGEYKNTQIPFEIKCPKGHTYKTNINDFKRYKCKQCLVRNEEEINHIINDMGFHLASKYGGYHEYSSFQCLSCGRIFETSLDNIKKGTACRFCYSSSYEKKVTEFLDLNQISFKLHDRILLKNSDGFTEIDFLIEDLKLAIEVCGNYYHSIYKKTRYYHLYKMLDCRKNGYDLITMFSHDILNFEWESTLYKILKQEPVLVESPFGYNFSWMTRRTEEFFNLDSSLIIPPKLVRYYNKKIEYGKISKETVWDCGHLLKLE